MQWIVWLVLLTLIYWTAIYLVDSIIRLQTVVSIFKFCF